MTILVTGGAGFIGSNFIHTWLGQFDEPVINLDLLTYAGNLKNLTSIQQDSRYSFVCGNIGDQQLVQRLLSQYKPRAIINFAAETHVDRSITAPESFIQTNIIGLFHLLQSTHTYWQNLKEGKESFRFLHISTDEVYGSLDLDAPPFTEISPYAPNSPYSASKAAGDHFVRSYFHTYGLPTLTTNCSNNYGPYQYPEKLIPLMIHNALTHKPLPLYGDGKNIRDWLYVEDHCDAVCHVLEAGTPGEVYNIGGSNQKQNKDVVYTLCDLLDEMHPDPTGSYKRLITYINDRPGHDHRYAMDSHKISHHLNWRPRQSFESGIRKTVQWYLDNQDWVTHTISDDYQKWIALNYGSLS